MVAPWYHSLAIKYPGKTTEMADVIEKWSFCRLRWRHDTAPCHHRDTIGIKHQGVGVRDFAVVPAHLTRVGRRGFHGFGFYGADQAHDHAGPPSSANLNDPDIPMRLFWA